MSKTKDKTGRNTGRKGEKADDRNLFLCSLRFYMEKFKLMYPEREAEEAKTIIQARNLCNGLSKRKSGLL